MKNFAIIILFLIFGCENSTKSDLKKPKSDPPIIAYNGDDYRTLSNKYPNRQITIVDTVCPFETKQANSDIKKNKLVYHSYTYIGEVLYELTILLKPYNITAKDGMTNCDRPPEGFKYKCYEQIMSAEIERRYGEKLIDSLMRIAIKNYIVKHPNEPFFEDGRDLRKQYLN